MISMSRFSVGAVALLTALMLSAGQSGAQYYPPYGPQYLPPPGVGPYRDRAAPPPYDEDDMAEEPPATRAAPAYPQNPYAVRPQPIDPRYTGRVAPPDGTSNPYEVPYGTPPRSAAPAPYGSPGVIDPSYPNEPAIRPPGTIGAPQSIQPTDPRQSVASLPPEDQPEVGEPKALPEQFRRQLVDYQTKEPAGTLVIDTPNTYLYLVLGNGKALRYGIGVGREGFTWAGHERISKMQEWPDWHPPSEMIQRQPYLPRFMAGGPGNPLGARALYLGNTLYRIHGTNQPSTIGQFVSSGCIRLVNDDIEDLFGRVQVGTRVVVLPGSRTPATASAH
jgi:lipoprotein-anchoring transpeptidase ErfK/SrfK